METAGAVSIGICTFGAAEFGSVPSSVFRLNIVLAGAITSSAASFTTMKRGLPLSVGVVRSGTEALKREGRLDPASNDPGLSMIDVVLPRSV